jgi:hypothetical protein
MNLLSGRMNSARVNIGFFTGFKTIKQCRVIITVELHRSFFIYSFFSGENARSLSLLNWRLK